MEVFKMSKNDFSNFLAAMDFVFKGNSPKYEGEMIEGVPHGDGKLYLDDTKVETTWDNGKPVNQCKITLPNGIVVDGDFPEGQGTISEPNGLRYEGEIRFFMKNGKGTITFPDGTKFEGNWINDVIHGLGTLFNQDESELIWNIRKVQ
jgi:hypothetical protein